MLANIGYQRFLDPLYRHQPPPKIPYSSGPSTQQSFWKPMYDVMTSKLIIILLQSLESFTFIPNHDVIKVFSFKYLPVSLSVTHEVITETEENPNQLMCVSQMPEMSVQVQLEVTVWNVEEEKLCWYCRSEDRSDFLVKEIYLKLRLQCGSLQYSGSVRKSRALNILRGFHTRFYLIRCQSFKMRTDC